jgi:hypothetical protein
MISLDIYYYGPAYSRNLEIWPNFEKKFPLIRCFWLCVILMKIAFYVASIITTFIPYLKRVSVKVVLNKEEKDEISAVTVIWPGKIWGGFNINYLPKNLNGRPVNCLTYFQTGNRYLWSKNRILLLQANLKLLLAEARYKSLNENISQLCWLLSPEPEFLLCLYKVLHQELQHLKSKNLFAPLEFYPETRLLTKLKTDLKKTLITSQHCYWEIDVIKALAPDRFNEKVDLLFVADERSKDILQFAANKVALTDYTGRYSNIIRKQFFEHK